MLERRLLLAVWFCCACRPPSEVAPPASPVLTAAPVPPPGLEPPPEEPAAPPAPANSAQPVEPGITSTGAPTRGKLPKAVIDEKLALAGPGIRACYERALQTQPKLRGNLRIEFVVATDGKVAHAQTVEVADELTDPATVDCILAELRKLEFPEPSGGRVFVNYPLKLEPAAR